MWFKYSIKSNKLFWYSVWLRESYTSVIYFDIRNVLFWSRFIPFDSFVFGTLHRVFENNYDVLKIALVSHYSVRGCPNVSHTEPGPGYVVKRNLLHCSPRPEVRGQVYAYMGLWSMMCHVRLFWSDLLWPFWYDILWYGATPPFSDSYLLWHRCREGDHVLSAEPHGWGRMWYSWRFV